MRKNPLTRTLLASSAALLVAITSGVATGIIPDPILPTRSKAYGKTYGEWSAAWWQWAIGVPCEFGDPFPDCSAHPFYDATGAAVSKGQSGKVWFVAAPFGNNERQYDIPRGTALFVALPVAECSSVEAPPFYGADAAEQSDCAKMWGDYAQDVFFEIDGVPVADISIHRVQSPQFSFVPPMYSLYGVSLPQGTAVSDGYWVFLTPLSVGEHELHYGGILVGTPFGDFEINNRDFVTVK